MQAMSVPVVTASCCNQTLDLNSFSVNLNLEIPTVERGSVSASVIFLVCTSTTSGWHELLEKQPMVLARNLLHIREN